MSEVLGKMEKPEAAQFKDGRKLFFVPLIVTPLGEDETITGLVTQYWKEVAEQLKNLENKLSQIKRIYHELLPGEESVNQLEMMKIGSFGIVQSLISDGAEICAIEDDEIMREFLDWNLCLSMQLQSSKVFKKLYDFFQESVSQRNEHLAKRIDETLQGDESAVLFMREGHRVQFPSDVQIFYVAPPALDALQRALREQQEKAHKHEPDSSEQESSDAKPEQTDAAADAAS
ncbi:MAG: hypothetical protein FWF98_01515 [Dehalococcoidia bacterium]|nr:hypothetical protein [Dehalococcoidia bacterium]